jgi:hypothetical protein
MAYLYNTISKLTVFNNSTRIITNIMRETPFSKMFNYQFEGAKFESAVNKLTFTAFYQARRIIKAIDDKNILKSIALNAL